MGVRTYALQSEQSRRSGMDGTPEPIQSKLVAEGLWRRLPSDPPVNLTGCSPQQQGDFWGG